MAETAGAPVIQKISPGLLNFLGLKNLGRGNPSNLSELLGPTLELNEWLLKPSYEIISAPAFNFAAVGGATIPITVDGATVNFTPDDETWWLWSANLQSTAALGAGQTLQMTFGYALATGLLQPLGPSSGSFTVGQIPIARSERPVLLPPHTFMAMSVQVLAAGPVAGSLSLAVTRMKN